VSARLTDLQPWLYPWARYLVSLFPELQLTSVYRTPFEQRVLYTRFLRGEGPYPVAPPGRSFHEHHRAFDLIGASAILESAGATWESWGGTWGGRFGDPIHFQA
jgi:hypothetical protein